MKKPVLLTVSGNIPTDIHRQIALGRRPRADYLELARGLDADLLDYAAARSRAGWVGKVLSWLGWSNLLLAYACWKLRASYRVIVTDGEQIGLPLAGLLKISGGECPHHLMIVHIISVPKKMIFLNWFNVQTHIDRFLVYSRFQKRFIEKRWGVERGRVIWTAFMVDDGFFSPNKVKAARKARPRICAVGLERRDYATLVQAVRGLDIEVIIAAASPWSKYKDSSSGQILPNNVQRQKYSQFDLRQVYADAELLVMPLESVDFQAGVTAILEAFSMGKPVICSDVPGQQDVVVEGENGRYVRAGDPDDLRDTIVRLISDPEECARMGAAGRQLIESEMNLDNYVDRLAQIVCATIDETDAS